MSDTLLVTEKGLELVSVGIQGPAGPQGIPGDAATSIAWGEITGTIASQTDLNSALTGKASTSHDHTGVYATSGHNHDGTYATSGHDHSGVYEPADATILKDADIGVSVAAEGHTHPPQLAVGAAKTFYLGETAVVGDNRSLDNYPTGAVEDTEVVACDADINAGVQFMERYVSAELGVTEITGGAWKFNTYASVDFTQGLSEVVIRLNKRCIKTGITVTITGSGATRTLTATGGTPFLVGDANPSILNASLVETPNQTFWISGFTSSSEVTVVPTAGVGYVNETDVTLTAMYYKLFEISTGDISTQTAALYTSITVQPSFAVDPTDRILAAYFGRTDSVSVKNITLYHQGTTHYTNIETPLVQKHGDLVGTSDPDSHPISAITGLQTALNNTVQLGKHTIVFPASAMKPRSTNGAALNTVEVGTNKIMVTSLDFDAAATEYAQFAVPMPKGWDEGTVSFRVDWSHAATTTNFGVAWGLQAVALSDGNALDTAWGTAVVVTDTGGTTNTKYQTVESGAITIGNTAAEFDWVQFQIYRDVAVGGDTMAIDARLHGISLYYTINAATDA